VSLDLFQQEGNERLTALPPVQNVDPGMFDGFVRGTGMATMKGFAKAARAVDLVGAVGPIVQDAFTGGTEAQDKYFAEHDAVFGRAVDYWTPRSNEIGMAGEVMGGLMSVLPQVIVSPGLAVATTQLGTAEDLANMGVTTGKAQAVGAVQGLTLGTGIWMPILGKNLWQRAVIGGAGFNLVQGTGARAASGAILEGTPAAEMFKAFDGEAMTLDVLMGLAFGGLVHYSPTQRAQGAKAWDQIDAWARNLNPSDKAAIATLREGQHLNLDSTPGKPVSDVDIEAHVNRMRAAIDQIASDQPVAVEDITVPRRTADIGEAPAEVRAMFEQEQQLRQEWTDAENSRGDAMERNDQEAIATWDAELQRIATDLQDVSTRRTELWAAEELDTQPRFEPDPERTAKAEATMRELAAEAETVRAEDGIPPPPQEPPRVVQSVRRTIEEQLVAAGRPAEEAAAGGAIWNAFYTTMAKRIGTTADDLWSRFPLARITNAMPGGEALKQGPNGEQVITVAGKDRPITNAEGKRIAADVEELKAFWNWFKDSKVVGQDGKPMVVYHGTEGAFNAFDKRFNNDNGIWGEQHGFFFTESPEQASKFATGYRGTDRKATPNVIPAYLSMENPKVIDFGKQSGAYGHDGLVSLKDFDRMVATAKDEGHDGVVILNLDDYGGRHTQYIAFEPTQIKSSIGNRGTFDPKNPDILFQDKRNTWYTSALGDAIANLNMKAAPAKGWLEALKGLGSKGVKADEVKWSGIEEWLQMQEGRVTREQVQDFLANNGVKVEEVMLGGKGTPSIGAPEIAADEAVLRQHGWSVEQNPEQPDYIAFMDADGNLDDVADLQRFADDGDVPQPVVDAAKNIHAWWQLAISRGVGQPTKFGTYQLPGGENYRELLLTLPTSTQRMGIDKSSDRVTLNDISGALYGKRYEQLNDTELAAVDAADKKRREEAAFQSSHFNEPNILAHIRFNERTDADGKKVLFIEEFQSDWAQKGKREGFNEKPKYTIREENGVWLVRDPDGISVNFGNSRAEAQAWADAHSAQAKPGVPPAPFVGKTDAWVGLAIKRMISYAAQNGFDRVAWTRGEQQVERYTSALRKAVDQIEWTKTKDGVQLVGYKGKRAPEATIDEMLRAQGSQIIRNPAGIDTQWGIRFRDGSEVGYETREAAEQAIRHEWDKDHGTDVNRQKVVDTTEKEDALSDAIGKAMAEKIISDPNQSGTIEGDGIRIDSTGMAGFYDRIVPKVANEVLKKLGGGKVADVRIDASEAMGDIGEGSLAVVRENGELIALTDYDSQAHEIAREHPGATVIPASEVKDRGANASRQQGFDITQAMKAKVDGGLPLFQKTKGTERGYMSIGDEGRIIGLLEGADASTFVHESGHFFLDTMADIGRLPDVPDAVRADLDTALGWMGVKDPAKWADMNLDEKRPYHEKFARGFEQYLRDGEAPSAELKGVFQRFRDWLVEIYKSAKSLNVKLNDDIRGVLNRMLADQTRNPSTEAPPAPSERTGSPPPPRSGGEVQAGAEVPLIEQPPIRTILQGIADNETGWAQIGGKLMDQSELGTGKPSFTTWIPKAEWWRDRPDKKMNGPQAQEAVRKALAGKKLKPIEQRMVDFMLKLADDRSRGLDQVGGADEYDALALNAYDEGLEPTTENVVDLDLVARAAAIDEAAVERAALMYENDDAAFRGELEMIIYEAERNQAAETAGRSTQGEPAPKPGEAGAKEPNAIRDAADRIVAENPDMLITIGKNPDGTSMTMRASDFLEQERAIADAAREDIKLFEAAATCLFGG